MSLADDTVVRRQVTVNAPLDRAFSLFTERFGDFKPKEHNMLGALIAETRFGASCRGHIYDWGEDGSECRWAQARLRAAEPGGVQLGHRAELATGGRRSERERGRGALHRRDPGANAHRAGAPPPDRRPRLGRPSRRRRASRRLAALPRPLRRPCRSGGVDGPRRPPAPWGRHRSFNNERPGPEPWSFCVGLHPRHDGTSGLSVDGTSEEGWRRRVLRPPPAFGEHRPLIHPPDATAPAPLRSWSSSRRVGRFSSASRPRLQ